MIPLELVLLCSNEAMCLLWMLAKHARWCTLSQARRGTGAQPLTSASSSVSIHVLQEDDDYFFISKPGGLSVVGEAATSTSFHGLVTEFARMHFGYHPNLLHRLDKCTSGLMVYAKNDEAGRHYLRQQDWVRHGSRVTKEYLAVVQGCPAEPKAGRVDGEIFSRGRKHSAPFVIHAAGTKLDHARHGRPVSTEYTTLRSCVHEKLGEVSGLSLRLLTGRKHQLRATCQYLGCPIVGDTHYHAQRHPAVLLHSHRIAFMGRSGRSYDVSAPVPRTWADLAGLVA